MSTPNDPAMMARLAEVAAVFGAPGRFAGATPCGSGHINDTWVVTLARDGGPGRFLLQRVNHRIFTDVPALMENVRRVTAHVATRVRATGATDASRRALTLLPTGDGAAWHRDATGDYWRAYAFIDGAESHDVISRPAQAEVAARAFGEFQRLLVDLPGPRLHETIPHFHDTRRRFDALQRVIAADPANRAAAARDEIALAAARAPLADTLGALQARGEIPERITHNDTKLNNVLLDARTGEALCVIDLDTVMPGLALHDFGDMVRSATNATDEDNPDLRRVHARPEIFEALVAGYLQSAGPFLNAAERAHLAVAGQVIVFEQAIRFLTDHLDGDRYYKIARPGHNLDRARNQFALLRSLEAQQATFEAVVARHRARLGL